MSCRPAPEIVAFVRDDLPAADAARIAAHVEACERCRIAVAESRQVLAALAGEPPPVDWTRYQAEVRARVNARAGRGAVSRGWRPLAVAAGLAAVALVAGLQLAPEPDREELVMVEPAIAAQLPLFEEYRIVERLELLEDLDVIRQLDTLPQDAS